MNIKERKYLKERNKIKEENSIDMGLFEKSSWFNNKVLFIISLVIMSFSSFISVFAVSSYLYNSNEVSFNNSSSSSINSSNVQGAIDELYADAHNYEEMSSRVAALEERWGAGTHDVIDNWIRVRSTGNDRGIQLINGSTQRGSLYYNTTNDTVYLQSMNSSGSWGQGKLDIVGSQINMTGTVKVNGTSVVYKAGDSITISGYNVYAGRLGWSRGKVFFTIPINKPIIASGATVSITSPVNIYAQDSMKSCTVGSIEEVSIKGNGAIVVRAAITPSTAWSSTGDSIGNVEIHNGMTITFN